MCIELLSAAVAHEVSRVLFSCGPAPCIEARMNALRDGCRNPQRGVLTLVELLRPDDLEDAVFVLKEITDCIS